ncbi:MAG: YihY family inner membrane protein, partial [Phycisphaerales bacterium]
KRRSPSGIRRGTSKEEKTPVSLNTIRQRVERALTEPGQELGRWARFARFHVELWRFCGRRLRENNVMAMSAALSFRTIFALIPTLVLAFLVARSLGALEDSQRSLRAFLKASGFAQIAVMHEPEGATSRPSEAAETQPARVINVADEIQKVVDRVHGKLTFARLGPVGGALLVWTAITLLTTIERSLNRIFAAPRSRPLVRRVLLYWAALTLGPIALAAASYVGRQAMETFQHTPGVSWLLVSVGWMGPVVAGIVVLAGLYMLLPNTSVPFRAALGGALAAVPVWLLAKWGFAVYVRHFVATGNLYGVLGLLPLFMLWLNLSWLILLFGAQLAYTATNLATMRLAERGESAALGPSDLLAASIAIAQPFAAGRGPAGFEQVTAALNLPHESVRWLIDHLTRDGIVCTVDARSEARYMLARPAERIPVLEILELGDPQRYSPETGGRDPEIARAIQGIRARTRSSLEGVTLADVLAARARDSQQGLTAPADTPHR